MKKERKEVSDKVVVILLIAAVVVSVLGAFVVYEYSHSYGIGEEGQIEDSSTGRVVLNVVEAPYEDFEEEADNENFE
jgi:hypothetical protein